jgi:dTDP-glucose 4,6-dehydratase
VLTRRPDAFAARSPHLACDEAVTLHAGDVRSFPFPARSFDHIVHGAVDASDKLNREDPAAMVSTIVDGTRRTLDFAERAGVRRFLLLSSGAVYGQQPAECTHVPETYRGGPETTDARSAYAEGKRLAELLCTLHARKTGANCSIARGFAFVGPYLPLDTHFAIGNFIQDCLHQRPIEIRGDGTPMRSYLYAADLAIWLWTILVRGESCRPYNVGSDRALSIRDVARSVAQAFDAPVRVHVAGSPTSGTPVHQYVPSIKRALDELNLRPLIGLEDAIRRTAAYSRSLDYVGSRI